MSEKSNRIRPASHLAKQLDRSRSIIMQCNDNCVNQQPTKIIFEAALCLSPIMYDMSRADNAWHLFLFFIL